MTPFHRSIVNDQRERKNLFFPFSRHFPSIKAKEFSCLCERIPLSAKALLFTPPCKSSPLKSEGFKIFPSLLFRGAPIFYPVFWGGFFFLDGHKLFQASQETSVEKIAQENTIQSGVILAICHAFWVPTTKTGDSLFFFFYSFT